MSNTKTFDLQSMLSGRVGLDFETQFVRNHQHLPEQELVRMMLVHFIDEAQSCHLQAVKKLNSEASTAITGLAEKAPHNLRSVAVHALSAAVKALQASQEPNDRYVSDLQFLVELMTAGSDNWHQFLTAETCTRIGVPTAYKADLQEFLKKPSLGHPLDSPV